MNLAKMNRVLEIFWWSMTIVTLVAVVIMCFSEGADKWMFYFLVPVICAILALVRRFMWKKLKKSEAFRDAAK